MGKKKYCTPAILLLQGGGDPGIGGGSKGDPNWPSAKGADYEPEWEENEESPLWE